MAQQVCSWEPKKISFNHQSNHRLFVWCFEGRLLPRTQLWGSSKSIQCFFGEILAGLSSTHENSVYDSTWSIWVCVPQVRDKTLFQKRNQCFGGFARHRSVFPWPSVSVLGKGQETRKLSLWNYQKKYLTPFDLEVYIFESLFRELVPEFTGFWIAVEFLWNPWFYRLGIIQSWNTSRRSQSTSNWSRLLW